MDEYVSTVCPPPYESSLEWTLRAKLALRAKLTLCATRTVRLPIAARP